ncbi:MAG: TetR/AcrR family transcriptional regulator [Streptosporangiales bacterium]|nr:TetR/AcrR family transcriptional regulator [Streptosporangiales bacterium]MBO0890191.1 TetR/AcrR family transcriptional regulator [Acidothermales bacterium]
MDKGVQTRDAILDTGVEVAFSVGLGGLTIGALAERRRMSKSGLFAHFRSKEALQLAVLERARETFTDLVLRPALAAPRGEPRLRELFERWLTYGSKRIPGVCLFVKAATEFDEQPGRLRDRLAENHQDMLDTIAQVCRTGVSAGHLRADTDAEQFAHDMYGVLLVFYLTDRLLDDPAAERRTRVAFDALLDAIRT